MINDEQQKKIKEFLRSPINSGLFEAKFKFSVNNKILTKYKDFYKQDIYPYDVMIPLKILEIFNFIKLKKDNQSTPFIKNNLIQDFGDKFLLSAEDCFENFDKISSNIKNIHIHHYNGVIIDGKYAFIFQLPSYENVYNYNNNFPTPLKFNNIMILLSTDESVLEHIIEILKSCKCIYDEEIKHIYSPKSKILSPVFDFTNFILNDLFTARDDKHYYQEAYNLYHQKKFNSSISYIGKMTESLLSTIYETVFKEYTPDNFTIGKIINELALEVEKIYKNKPIEPANFNIRNDIKNISNIEDIKKTLQKIITLLVKEQKYNNSINTNSSNTGNIFPKEVHINLNHILKYRNSVSHNSGQFFYIDDCNKVLFYFLSIFYWWEEIYKHINWNDTSKRIIENIVEYNKS